MGLITDVLDSLASDTTLGKRERRLIDSIMFQYNELSKAQKHLEQILQTRKITINDLKKDRKNIDDQTLKLVENIKRLMQKEAFEVDKDIREPFDLLKELMPIVEQYFTYAQKEKTLSRTSIEKIKAMITEINRVNSQVIEHLYTLIENIATMYGSEIRNTEKSYASFNIDQFLSIGVQLEQQKLQLSKTIRSLTKKINELKKELNRSMNTYFKERKHSPKYKITSLYEEQKKDVESALRLLEEKEIPIPLPTIIQNKIKTHLQLAFAKEQQILNEMFAISIPSKLNQMLTLQKNPEKTQTQKIIDKLKFYKTKAGFYPIEFWLGEKRALGFLALNDVKNIANLKTLLQEGLLHKEYGMLTERIDATEQLIKEGYLNSQHEEFISFLEQYVKNFEEVDQLILTRADLTQKVLTLLGGILANINKEIRLIQIRTDETILALEQEEEAKLKQGQDRARIAAEVRALETTKKEEAAITADEQAAITTTKKEGVSRLIALEDVTRKTKTRSNFWMQRMFQKAAMILLPIMAAGALGLSATSTAEAHSSEEVAATREYNSRLEQKLEVKKIHEQQEQQKQEARKGNLESLKDKVSQNKSPVELLSSLTPEEMNALYHQNKLSLSWTLKSFSVTRLGELSNEAERIYKKINSNKELTQTETNFIKNYYYILAIGGKLKGAETASELLVHYIEGTGKDLEIESNIYQESEAVKKAQEEMTRYILKGQQSGKLTSKGTIQSNQVFTTIKSFSGGYAKSGGTAAGEKGDRKIYLLAEQDNAPLKNANNRFILTANYKTVGNKLFIEWRVDDDYSFENSDYKTVIPLPIGEGEIVIRDRLSFFLTKYGAKKFNHHASWDAVYNTGDLT